MLSDSYVAYHTRMKSDSGFAQHYGPIFLSIKDTRDTAAARMTVELIKSLSAQSGRQGQSCPSGCASLFSTNFGTSEVNCSDQKLIGVV